MFMGPPSNSLKQAKWDISYLCPTLALGGCTPYREADQQYCVHMAINMSVSGHPTTHNGLKPFHIFLKPVFWSKAVQGSTNRWLKNIQGPLIQGQYKGSSYIGTRTYKGSSYFGTRTYKG